MADPMSPALPPVRVVAQLCLAEALSMTASATFPVLLPLLLRTWSLSNSEAGLIGSAYFGGYMAAVPILTSLTDRVDARRVYLFATLLSCTGALGFALFADGFWSAAASHAVIGAGLAGTYMPGLKVLSDHVSGRRQSRYVAFYTSTFGIGTSLSLWMAGMIVSHLDWRWAFGLAAVGPMLAGVLVFTAFPPRPPHPAPEHTARLLDFRPVFRNRAAMGYVLAYAAHCWELFGFRSWIVAFLAFAAGMQSAENHPLWGAATLAAGINLLGPGASILGNEIAVHFGRRRVVLAMMAISAACAWVVGFTALLPWYIVFVAMVVYFLAIMGDSAALTAGVVAAARHSQRGVTMAVHSTIGFGAGFIAPAVFGVVLDIAGGNANPLAWGFAFASLAVGYIIGPLALALLRLWLQRRRGR